MEGLLASNRSTLFDHSMSYGVKDVKDIILSSMGLSASFEKK